MPTLPKSDNSQPIQPTPATESEKMAMKRALDGEKSADLFRRLESENNASRADALLSQRKHRE